MSIYSPTTARTRGVSFTRLKFQCNIQNSLNFIVCLHFWLPFFSSAVVVADFLLTRRRYIAASLDIAWEPAYDCFKLPSVCCGIFFSGGQRNVFVKRKKPKTPTYMWTRLKKNKCDKYYHSVLLLIQAKLMFCASCHQTGLQLMELCPAQFVSQQRHHPARLLQLPLQVVTWQTFLSSSPISVTANRANDSS